MNTHGSTIDPHKILDRIADMRKAVKELSTFAGMSKEEFLADTKNEAVVSFWLLRAIEAALTIANHIIAHTPGERGQKDYTKSLLWLGDRGIIPKEFAQKIQGMASVRNRLVHMYWEVKPEKLHDIAQNDLDDLRHFADHVQEWLRLSSS